MYRIALFALLLPACSSKSTDNSPAGVDPVTQDPDLITVDIQNDDPIPYDVELDELTSGVISTRVRMFWPIGAAVSGPVSGENSWDFHPDSATCSHALSLYSTGGILLESVSFVKSDTQLLLVVTISGGKMNVQETP